MTYPHANSLSFLLSQAGAHAAELFAERLEILGLTPRAYGVLSSIAAGGGQTQQQLADALGMHRNNMVGLLDELEARGLAQRDRSSADRRAFTITLSRKGRALVRRAADQLPSLDDQLTRELTTTERATLQRLLNKIAAAEHLTPGVHPHLRNA